MIHMTKRPFALLTGVLALGCSATGIHEPVVHSLSDLAGRWMAATYEVSKPDEPEITIDLLDRGGMRELSVSADGSVVARTRAPGAVAVTVQTGELRIVTDYLLELRFVGDPVEHDLTFARVADTLKFLEEVEFAFVVGGPPERAIFRTVLERE